MEKAISKRKTIRQSLSTKSLISGKGDGTRDKVRSWVITHPVKACRGKKGSESGSGPNRGQVYFVDIEEKKGGCC